MRNRMLILTLAAMCLTAPYALAGEGHDHGAKAADAKSADASKEAQATTLVGEIVDTGCFLAHGARGEKHASCAAKCIGDGMPMGLLTEAGTLYLLTPNHDNPDAYNKLKTMSAKTVTVKGAVMERNGMKGLDVTGYEPVAMKMDSKMMDSKMKSEDKPSSGK